MCYIILKYYNVIRITLGSNDDGICSSTESM